MLLQVEVGRLIDFGPESPRAQTAFDFDCLPQEEVNTSDLTCHLIPLISEFQSDHHGGLEPQRAEGES
ncbi:hypothetical protein J6590_032189 [Homalodisca vitripennis]|nr:hypothetical protein J6590_032189 [Homalodisca vitripennis]